MTRTGRATELQRRVANNHFLQGVLADYLIQCEDIPRPLALNLSSFILQLIAEQPEPYIKQWLLAMYGCSDITSEQQQEIAGLMRASETALTSRQLQQLKEEYLY